jgi:iron complex transport system ATP-binding protein
MTTLTLNSVAIGYATRTLVRDVNFTLRPGEAIAVLGRNGSGKTTLFRAILGLLAPMSGEICIGEKNVGLLAPADIARVIAYVPQAINSTLGLRVIEVVEMARAPHLAWYARPLAKERKIAEAALTELNMHDFAERRFDELSGGEKQLVLIARALAAQAPIILMDEPTANLDFGNQYLILDEIAKLKRRGISVLFTTHAPDHALRIADRTLTMARDGRARLGATRETLTADALTSLYDVPVELVPFTGGVMTTVQLTTRT